MDGVLVLDKPGGITSRKAATRAARVLGTPRSGHAGTLDPLATGVLPVLLGRATLLSSVLSGGTKCYLVEAVLGIQTDTYDSEGEVVARKDASGVTDEAIDRAAESLTGTIEQSPPAFSAVKHRGKPLYRYAREGRPVPSRAREVRVDSFELLSVEREAGAVTATLEVTCGPGTYVRSLVHELGGLLGCGAAVSGLRRILSGRFGIERAVTLEELEREDTPQRRVLSMEEATGGMPTMVVWEEAARAVRFGKKLPPESAGNIDFRADDVPDVFRVLDTDGTLLALYGPPAGEADMGCYRVRRVLRPANAGETLR
ncbi:MAG: tRNA pseudouridine(55) synthase TruB [Actinomycetota bacterium]